MNTPADKERQSVYLAGPMRGYPEYNFPAFHAAAAKLRGHGLEVWSPAENDVHADGFDPTKEGSHAPLRHYMKRDLPAVLNADMVCVLPGWEKSQGAQLEVHVARTCGIPVYWADTLQSVTFSSDERSRIVEECAKYVEAEANSCLPGSSADDQNWGFALQSCATAMSRDLLKNAAPQAPCEPCPSKPGPSDRIAPTACNIAGLEERDSLVQPAVAAPSRTLAKYKSTGEARPEVARSDTPRTDAALLDAKLKRSFPNASFVHADFARQLERELAEALRTVCPGNGDDPDPVRCQSYEASGAIQPHWHITELLAAAERYEEKDAASAKAEADFRAGKIGNHEANAAHAAMHEALGALKDHLWQSWPQIRPALSSVERSEGKT